MFNIKYRLKKKIHEIYTRMIVYPKIKKEIRNSTIKIMTIDETLDQLEKGMSIARFGDGELDVILGGRIGFQSQDVKLAKRLKEILVSKPDNCIIGVPDAINTLDNLTRKSLDFWIPNMVRCRNKWVELLTQNPRDGFSYGNTNVSRCYIRYQDKTNSKRWFERLMDVWKDKDVVIIEGEKTRLGCGNDFLKTAKTVKRILGPAENAFDKIDEILDYTKNNIDKSTIIILALGPTATVLAYELAQLGYQALDLGHCDIEYEWYLMGTDEKVVVKGKYTNEVMNGKDVDDTAIDLGYLNEVIKRF